MPKILFLKKEGGEKKRNKAFCVLKMWRAFKKDLFSINKGEEMLCKPKCLADIRLLPSRRQGVLRFSELMRKAHP